MRPGPLAAASECLLCRKRYAQHLGAVSMRGVQDGLRRVEWRLLHAIHKHAARDPGYTQAADIDADPPLRRHADCTLHALAAAIEHSDRCRGGTGRRVVQTNEVVRALSGGAAWEHQMPRGCRSGDQIAAANVRPAVLAEVGYLFGYDPHVAGDQHSGNRSPQVAG